MTSFGESLHRELREQDSDSDDEELSEEYIDVSAVSGFSDTDADSQSEAEKKTKQVPINSALKEQIMTELTAPTKFTGRRYSVAVAIPSGEQHLVELGTSVHATVARNMDSEVFTVSSNKDSSEYLEMLRERKKSRSQLTKAHTLAKSLDLDGGLHESSPKPGMPVSPPKMKKSIPLIRLEDEEDEVEEGDIISKLVGRNSLLSTPTRNNRKVSLQEELCGMSPRQVNKFFIYKI